MTTDFGTRLRCIRLALDLSQSEFAAEIRKAGKELEDANQCSKDLVQKWEAGRHGSCRPNYKRALQRVTGLSFEQLCAPWAEPEAQAQLLPPSGGLANMADAVKAIDSVMAQLGEAKAWLTASAAATSTQSNPPDPT